MRNLLAGVTRFLVRSGAKVTVTDSKSETDLRESVEQLRSLPVIFKLGGHDERDFRDADLVIVNPAVPETNPYLKLARALETEMNLFFKLCRAETIVVNWYAVPERATIYGWPVDLGPFAGLWVSWWGRDSLRGTLLFDQALGVQVRPGITAQFVAGRRRP